MVVRTNVEVWTQKKDWILGLRTVNQIGLQDAGMMVRDPDVGLSPIWRCGS